jgi:hypothetical protein
MSLKYEPSSEPLHISVKWLRSRLLDTHLRAPLGLAPGRDSLRARVKLVKPAVMHRVTASSRGQLDVTLMSHADFFVGHFASNLSRLAYLLSALFHRRLVLPLQI